MDVLRFFAADSGGRAYLVSESMMGGKNNQFDKVLLQIAEELRSQYSIAYSPTHSDDGQYHNIRVQHAIRLPRSGRARVISPGDPPRLRRGKVLPPSSATPSKGGI